MSVGRNIKRLRNRVGKSQQEVADLLDIDRKTYAKWEAETCEVKSNYIPQLADIFEVEITDLFKEKTTKVNISPKFTDNNNFINAVVFLTDKDALDKLMEVLNNTFKKEE